MSSERSAAAAEPVKIGFVGVGYMGQLAHLRHYAALPGCEVVAIAEPRARTAARVAQRYGVDCVYADPQQMLSEHRLDGIVASQPYERHAFVVPPLLRDVRCLFTEKPLANSAAQGAALVAAAREAGAVHMVGYQKRCDPAVVAARALIDEWRASGRAGALRYVRVSVAKGNWLLRADTSHVDEGDPRPAAELEPRPASIPPQLAERYDDLVNFYVHDLNLIRHLLGEPYALHHADPAGVLYLGASASGVSVALEGLPHADAHGWNESALVAFERGWVRIALPPPLAWEAGRVEAYDGTLTVLPVEQVPAFRRQAEAFVAVCRGEQAPPADAAEALLDLELIEQAIGLLA